MAMYYQGSSEIQADGLQTLYLLNPNYVGGYSDTHYMNSAAAHAPNSAPVPHAPPAQQFVGIPLSHDPSRPSPALPQQEDIQAVHNTIPRFHYNNNNIWNLFDQSGNGNQPNMPQGLSLSLSQHQTGFDDKSLPSDHDFRPVLGLISSKISSSSPSNGANSMQSVIMGSKYLEAAQQLLDEVANVGKGSKIDRPEPSKDKAKIIEKLKGEASSGNNGGGAELTTPQRQEIQMKKAKLISMLDEVDQRYKQYHHQMQIIVASFEQAAGIGSAKSYTQLALNTILKQFKCLKSAISAQIKALSKTLGEDDQSLVEGSRLKFVDHHLRQQKAMQQMGMMQNNAWRPQRGLPERAISVLRAWLFEHFLHPYPKDSDKVMLAKQTGLTRSQVSNWFINARVRLWKPMVEEMYLEEMKNQEQISPETTSKTGPRQKESNSKKNNITPPVIDHLQSKQDNLILNLDPSPTEISPSTITNSPTGSSLQGRSGFAQFITSLNVENLSEKNPKKPRNDHSLQSRIFSMEMETKGAGNTSKGLQTRENYLSMAAANTCTQGPGFGTYGIREFSRFNGDQQISPGNFPGNNNFSLTLALPPSETSQRTHHQQNFFSHRNFEFETRIENESNGINNRIESDSHPNIGYEILDFQNRKQFPAQLLPDFVAS